jgi:hypothetical protein
MPTRPPFRAALAAALAVALAAAASAQDAKAVFAAAAPEAAEAAAAKPSIIIYDVVTGSYDPSKSRLLTDVLRSELFKTRLFDIIEKGVVQEAGVLAKVPDLAKAEDAQLLAVGRAARADKLMICSVEKFDKTIAISIRIVNVATSVIDYTDNVFLADENLLFDAIKEIAAKIDFYYAADKPTGLPGPAQDQAAKWRMLKAEGADLEYLTQARVDPEEYLTIRQYDISFTPAQYVAILQSSIDPAVIRSFLQAGIPYSQVERALALGITKLDLYRETFQPAGLAFADYLVAYERNITTVRDYLDYQRGFNASYLNVGVGGVSDSFPIANAVYKFALGKVSWERFWTPYQRDFFKLSTDSGLMLLNMFAPTPFFQVNAYLGSYPYYFKIGAGAHAEVILGGHVGAFVQLGFEVMESLDFAVIVVPFGTQPAVSYTDLTTRLGQADYIPIYFPYAGVVVSYKLPLRGF